MKFNRDQLITVNFKEHFYTLSNTGWFLATAARIRKFSCIFICLRFVLEIVGLILVYQINLGIDNKLILS